MAVTPFPIIAYFPSWIGCVQDIPFRKITHLNYAFALTTAAGTLTGIEDARLRELLQRGQAQGVKVGLAIGGWNDGDCSAFEGLSSHPETRSDFIRHVTELCDHYGLDGVDIDWEYPQASSAENFSLLMLGLRAALGTRRYLSAAVIAEGDEYGAHVHPDVFASVDFLNIMAYDWLYQTPGTHHSPFSLAESGLTYWIRRGCPPKKAVLGVPFYGRSHEATVPYRDLVAADPQAHLQDQVGAIQYNGLETMRAKTRLAMRTGGGIMFWEITQDARDPDTSLLNAIHETVRGQVAPIRAAD